MKELNFKTSKGEFILLDGDADGRIKLPTNIEYQELGRVKYMTKEQFYKVLDNSIHTGLFAHYVKDVPVNTYCYLSGMDSLHSLVNSLGWYLWDNPYSNFADETGCQEAESKTLYNPILLKKI